MPSMCPKCPEVPGNRSPVAPSGTSHSPKRSGKCTSGARPPGTWPNGSPPAVGYTAPRDPAIPPGFSGDGWGLPSGSGITPLHSTNLPDTCIFRQQFHLVNRDLVQLHQPFLLGNILIDKKGI